jgi:hypothetical protein
MISGERATIASSETCGDGRARSWKMFLPPAISISESR